MFRQNEHFLLPDTHTYLCVSEGKKCSFFEKFGVLCFLVTSILKFALSSYYRRLHASVLFYSPRKHQKWKRLSNVCRGDKKGTLAWNWSAIEIINYTVSTSRKSIVESRQESRMLDTLLLWLESFFLNELPLVRQAIFSLILWT